MEAMNPAAIVSQVKSLFIRRVDESEKPEVNWDAVKILGISFVVLFVGIVLWMPTEQPVEFTEKLEDRTTDSESPEARTNSVASNLERDDVWARPRMQRSSSGGSEVNYNTSMILAPNGLNARTQVRAGHRLPLRISDKFIVSDSPVPILADLLFAVQTDSGLRLPAGTRFYGQATFQKGQDRAQIRFTQISFPSGEILPVSGLALSKDGQSGIVGRVYSDGAKNTVGQVLTTFIGGLAEGSVETDMFGNSRGGVQNGLLSAVAATAKDRAQSYGDKLKAEREWIEVAAGTECDGSFEQSLDLQGASRDE